MITLHFRKITVPSDSLETTESVWRLFLWSSKKHTETLKSREYKVQSKVTQLDGWLDVDGKGQGKAKSDSWVSVTEAVIGPFTERENSIKRFQGEIKFNCEHSRSVEHLNGDITIQKTGT